MKQRIEYWHLLEERCCSYRVLGLEFLNWIIWHYPPFEHTHTDTYRDVTITFQYVSSPEAPEAKMSSRKEGWAAGREEWRWLEVWGQRTWYQRSYVGPSFQACLGATWRTVTRRKGRADQMPGWSWGCNELWTKNPNGLLHFAEKQLVQNPTPNFTRSQIDPYWHWFVRLWNIGTVVFFGWGLNLQQLVIFLESYKKASSASGWESEHADTHQNSMALAASEHCRVTPMTKLMGLHCLSKARKKGCRCSSHQGVLATAGCTVCELLELKKLCVPLL